MSGTTFIDGGNYVTWLMLSSYAVCPTVWLPPCAVIFDLETGHLLISMLYGLCLGVYDYAITACLGLE